MPNRPFLPVCALTALTLYFVGLSLLFLFQQTKLIPSMSAGAATACLMTVTGFLINRRAYGMPTGFYRLIFGGMAGRFVFFILAMVIIYKFTDWSPATFIVAFALFYAVLQGIEIRFLTRQFKK